MRMVFDSYQEERAYWTVNAVLNAIFSLFFYSLAVSGSLWWWLPGTLFLLVGTSDVMRFKRTSKEHYERREAELERRLRERQRQEAEFDRSERERKDRE